MKPAPVDDPQLGGILERLGGAMLGGMYDEQARRAGRRFSSRTRVPGVMALGELDPIASLASLVGSAEAQEIVDTACSRCGCPLRAPRLTMNCVACDPCREKAQEEEAEAKYTKRWNAICPASSIFRTTDPTHPSFPRSQYEATKQWYGDESMIFLGPSGTGKTRLAMHLLKRCLFVRSKSIGVLWPETLAHYARNQFERSAGLDEFSCYDVLLLDDPFLGSAADDRMTSFIRELLDIRVRLGKCHLITSQFGGVEYRAAFDAHMEHSGRKATAQDWARFDALFRRTAERARVVSFGAPPAASPQDGALF